MHFHVRLCSLISDASGLSLSHVLCSDRMSYATKRSMPRLLAPSLPSGEATQAFSDPPDCAEAAEGGRPLLTSCPRPLAGTCRNGGSRQRHASSVDLLLHPGGYLNHVLAVVAPLSECQQRGLLASISNVDNGCRWKRELTTGKRYQASEPGPSPTCLW